MATFKYPSINMKATGKRITSLMEDRGITVDYLKEALGFVNPQSIYKWKRGECLPNLDNLIALAVLFKTPIEKILVCSA